MGELTNMTFNVIKRIIENDMVANRNKWKMTDYHRTLTRDNPEELRLNSYGYRVMVQGIKQKKGFFNIAYEVKAGGMMNNVVCIQLAMADISDIPGSISLSPSPGYVDITGCHYNW